jgi:hypothetical protein
MRVAWSFGLLAAACGGSAPGMAGDGSSDSGGAGETTGAAETEGDETGAPVGCPGAGPLDVAPSAGWLDDPLAEFPETLSELGLYPMLPDRSVVADVAIAYTPAWPLWSNGSDKHRFLVLPPGTAVDTSDPDRWVFPVGTVLLKTFAYASEPDAHGCARPVETRVLRKTDPATWDYAAYGWDPDGLDGPRLDIAEPVPIDVDGPEGPLVHHVPARIECRSCHESAIGEVLGFERLQLSAPGDDGAPSRLVALTQVGILDTSNDPVLVEHPDDTTRHVLGMLTGNCVHCHNGSGGPSSSFDLRHDVALANTIDVPTDSSASASGTRIVPGDPASSILFLAVSGEGDDPEISAMPPTGVDRRDAESIERLRAFILQLP